MKKKIMSIILTIVLIISLVGCGTSNTTVAEQMSSSAIAESTAESLAGSEAEEETNPWFDYDAYHKRLEAAGLPWKLNDDGSRPKEWTVEFYETEEYAGCDGLTIGDDGFFKESSFIYDELYSPNYDALTNYDWAPEEQTWAMKTADFKRAAPDIDPPKYEDLAVFKEDAYQYLKSKGLEKYPFTFLGYGVILDAYNDVHYDMINVTFTFLNDDENRQAALENVPVWTATYSTKDYSLIGYTGVAVGADSIYGKGTYKKAIESVGAIL